MLLRMRVDDEIPGWLNDLDEVMLRFFLDEQIRALKRRTRTSGRSGMLLDVMTVTGLKTGFEVKVVDEQSVELVTHVLTADELKRLKDHMAAEVNGRRSRPPPSAACMPPGTERVPRIGRLAGCLA